MSIKNISHEDVPLSKIVHRLELSSIRTFVVQDANDLFPAASFSIPETFTSRVEDLRFERSVLHAENFRKLLSACSSLRRFAFGHHSIKVLFRPIEMIEGLMASKETLEFIEARVSKEYINYYLLDIVFVSQPCSFANFTKLKEIVVSAGLILYDRIGGIPSKNTKTDHIGAFLQRIPRSLQKLTLKDCYLYNHKASAAIMALVREKERYAPDLKYINLSWRDCYPEQNCSSMGDLIEECKAEGIELVLHLSPCT